MYVDMREKIVVSSSFHGSDAERLLQYCEQLSRSGRRRIVLDVAAVEDCDGDGLACWKSLTTSSPDLTVTITGAHWSQFLALLQSTPLTQIARVCTDIRGLLTSSRRRAAPSR